jgi:hypothetical protein
MANLYLLLIELSEMFRLLCNNISFNAILSFFIYTSLCMQAVSLLAVKSVGGIFMIQSVVRTDYVFRRVREIAKSGY